MARSTKSKPSKAQASPAPIPYAHSATAGDPDRLIACLFTEDQQRLFELIQEVRASADKPRWLVELCRLIETRRDELEGHWHSVEIFAIETELVGEHLRGFLENLLFFGTPLSIDARITVYSLLRCSGSTQLFDVVNNDKILRAGNTPIWMDLFIASAPETQASLEDARVQMIGEIRKGSLGLQYLTERLNLLAKLGIGDLTRWIARVRKALPANELLPFDDLMNRAFGQYDDEADEDLEVVSKFLENEEKKPTHFERMRNEIQPAKIDDESMVSA
jgi:hypothetical protein